MGRIPVVPGSESAIAAQIASNYPLISSVSMQAGALRVEVNTPSLATPYWIQSDWEATLFEGAIADQFAANGDSQPTSMDVVARDPNGQLKDLGGGLGNVVRGQIFGDVNEASFSIGVTSGAASLGLKNVSVSFIRGLTSSIPVVTAVSPDPASFLKALVRPEAWTQLLGSNPKALEGYFIEVTDSVSGDIVFVSGNSSRVGAGEGWSRPDVTPSAWRDYPPTVPAPASGP
ncbi:MAG TPA: hypothetical protein VGO31_01070 [Microbacteriaceae bacterium]|nr:hypothetical protein [Microbacteriaceae bacterium]